MCVPILFRCYVLRSTVLYSTVQYCFIQSAYRYRSVVVFYTRQYCFFSVLDSRSDPRASDRVLSSFETLY